MASASSRAIVVLPTPGRAPEDDRAEVPLGEHRAERAVGAEQVVLADDLLEPARAQPVGERPRRLGRRRGAVGRARVEEVGHRRTLSIAAGRGKAGRGDGGTMDGQAIGAALAAARRHLAANPDERIVDDSVARARLAGGLATVVEGSAGQRLTTDMPAALGGGGTAATPGWTLRAAVASCTATTIALRAAELGVTLTRLEVDGRQPLGRRRHDRARRRRAPPGPLDAMLVVSLDADGMPPGGSTRSPAGASRIRRWPMRSPARSRSRADGDSPGRRGHARVS